MKIIALTGRKQHGKDTVCRLIGLLAGQSVCRFAFADPLKREVAQVCGVTVADIEREKVRYRGMLQWWGTEFRRGQNESYWIEKARSALENAVGDCEIAVVTDCRFQNEAALIKELGGIIVRVERHGFDLPDLHASETEMAQIHSDYTIANRGDMTDLEREVQKFILELDGLFALPQMEATSAT